MDILRTSSRRPRTVLRQGDDALIIDANTRQWFFTTGLGADLFEESIRGSVEAAAHAHGMSVVEVAEFIQNVTSSLEAKPPVGQAERGCSVYVTDACNMRCRHCRFACATSKAKLTEAAITRYLDVEYARGARHMTVTGGEPLMAWPLTRFALAHARTLGMKSMLLTNGSLLTDERACAIASLGCSVQISVDSADPHVYESFRRHPFQPVIDGIDRLVSQGVRPTLSCTLSRISLPGIDRVIDFAIEHRASSLHFAMLERGGRAAEHWESLGVDDETLIEFFRKLADRYFNEGLRNRLRLDEFEMFMNQLVHPSALNGCNCATAISSLYEDGDVYGCTNLAGDPAFCIGRAEDDATTRTQGEDTLRKRLPTVNDIADCRACLFRFVCLGGCRDRVLLASSGNGLRPDPYCRVLYALFERLIFEAARAVEAAS